MNGHNSSNAAVKVKKVGNYNLSKTIGSGTFGKVKLGTHILTDALVAVKILERRRIADSSDVERVSREIHILKLLRHPHIIQLFEIVETSSHLYLVMEYASGGELFDHIVETKRLDEGEARMFFRQIVAGVEAMHAHGVVHRDLKPENLLRDHLGNIKIVDFGLSNTFRPGEFLKTACGSPCYASPEMIGGKRYDPERSDAWSLGIIVYAMVCGYLPFEDSNTAVLYRKITKGDFELPDYLSSQVCLVLKGLLTTDPSTRLTLAEVKRSPWFSASSGDVDGSKKFQCCTEGCGGCRSLASAKDLSLDDDVLAAMTRYDCPLDYAIQCLKRNKHNHATTIYYLLLAKKLRGEPLAGMLKNPRPKTAPCPSFSIATPQPLPSARRTERPAPYVPPVVLPFTRPYVPPMKPLVPVRAKNVDWPARMVPIRTPSVSPGLSASTCSRPQSSRLTVSRVDSPYMCWSAAPVSARVKPQAAAFGSSARRLEGGSTSARPNSARTNILTPFNGPKIVEVKAARTEGPGSLSSRSRPTGGPGARLSISNNGGTSARKPATARPTSARYTYNTRPFERLY